MSALPAGGLRHVVVTAIASSTGATPAAVESAASLFDLPGFDSIAVVAVLEWLEDQLGLEVPAEWIVPETFRSVGALTAVVTAARTAAATSGSRR